MPMQPLSRVGSSFSLDFLPSDVMTARPDVAVLVAECIAEWAQVECILGVILAIILETEAQTGLAMYGSLTSSNNQMTILSSAARAKLVKREVELFEAVMMLVRSAAKERHRLAHWCWAISADLPDALLLIDPAHQAPLFANLLGYHDPLVEIDRTKIFVFKKADAQATVTKIKSVKAFISRLLSVLHTQNRAERLERLQTLSSEPQILEALSRLRRREGRLP